MTLNTYCHGLWKTCSRLPQGYIWILTSRSLNIVSREQSSSPFQHSFIPTIFFTLVLIWLGSKCEKPGRGGGGGKHARSKPRELVSFRHSFVWEYKSGMRVPGNFSVQYNRDGKILRHTVVVCIYNYLISHTWTVKKTRFCFHNLDFLIR